ncbi:hypothetical protein [Pararhizobium mangrovi]|uniref:Glycosyltransferase RgtA/B/C/D-like domain-containing protein n=1 Tax=Pararhizobium mangrovi TaxID=2590452 RepID=A0A506UHJ6_9HYPH|nr:hypothetical protein [Pararhizobium mangrovi]TPW32783.1 hypothetical protein FJU11_00725 [Pararhizobium mangrovi]
MTVSAGGASRLDRAASFVAGRLARRDEDRFWLGLTLAAGIVSCVVFLVAAFASHGIVEDDARMFLSWMGRWDDPGLLNGDLMADFWSSVSPWAFRAVYRAAWWLGIEPLVFARILPALLFPPTAWLAYRFVRAIGAEPIIGFAAAVTVLHFCVRHSVSPTPRIFWPLLFLSVLDGLARGRILQTGVAQFFLAATYPQVALTTSGVVGLSLFTPWRRPMFDFSRLRIAIVGFAALCTVAGVAPFILHSDAFGPTATLADAKDMPVFSATGRDNVLTPAGRVDVVCGDRAGLFSGARAGIVGSDCTGPADPKLIWLIGTVLLGPVVLFLRMFARMRDPSEEARPATSQTGRLASALPIYIVVSALVGGSIAAMVLFELHLPSRYTRPFLILPGLVTWPLAFEWLRDIAGPRIVRGTRSGRIAVFATGCAMLLFAFVFVSVVKPSLRAPRDPALIAAIRALPKDAVVGGFVGDLDFSPVLTKRSTLFSRELAIAYQLGYFRHLKARMNAVRDIVLTNDPVVLADRIRSLGLDRLLVHSQTLSKPQIPADFRGFFGKNLTERERRAGESGPSALSRYAAACEKGRYRDVLVLDAACLVDRSNGDRNAGTP